MLSITQWKARFMARRDLNYPTGRPLYTYRVTKEDVPDWCDWFPFPVEYEQAKGLIEQLIRDIAGREVRAVQYQHISVERWLEQVPSDQALSDQWSLRSDIVLPEYLDATALGKLFEIDPNVLTRTPTLRLLPCNGAQAWEDNVIHPGPNLAALPTLLT